jgi:uroporphyrinogen III methyltransferase / synthase
MTVYLVGAGPGDPGLLTCRAAELLGRADVVLYDRLVTPEVLALAPPRAALVDVGKRAGDGVSGIERQTRVNQLLIDHGRAADTVVRLKGGDPFLFGRGGEEAEALAGAGVAYEVVPGVTSAVAVPGAAGIPVTHRGLATSVTVVAGRTGEGSVDWEAMARTGGTLVVLMGVADRAALAERLVAAGRAPETPVAVVERGTTFDQRTVRTTLAGLGGAEVASPATIVIGPVASLDLVPQRALSGATVVVTRSGDQAPRLVAALAGAGARVVEVPTIAIADPDDHGVALRAGVAAVDGYDWVLFTSATAVRRFVPLLRDGRTLAGVRLAAIGAATAHALSRFRLVADLVPAAGTAVHLAAALNGVEGGRRALYPRAEWVRPDFLEALRTEGWTVDEVVAYRTLPVDAPRDEVAAQVAAADAITFASGSAVAAYLAMRTSVGTPLGVPPVVACIGPSTAAAANEAGLTGVVEAEAPTPSAMVEAVGAALGRTAQRSGPARALG